MNFERSELIALVLKGPVNDVLMTLAVEVRRMLFFQQLKNVSLSHFSISNTIK